ncbi:MAG: molybdenum cofactor biosynthesis protein MoaE [Rhodothermales bacterium]|nr:molybdenum cofactor biosynthesis protein MoaE [Rhodothermales bacterium]
MERIRIILSAEPLKPEDALSFVADESAGGTCLFIGSTRSVTDGRETVRLSYEAHESMARNEMVRLAEQILEEWPVHRIAIVHRLGVVEAGQASVVVAVSSAHRAEAFAASRAAIDRLKETVPIWKKETFADGSVEWVDPLG